MGMLDELKPSETDSMLMGQDVKHNMSSWTKAERSDPRRCLQARTTAIEKTRGILIPAHGSCQHDPWAGIRILQSYIEQSRETLLNLH